MKKFLSLMVASALTITSMGMTATADPGNERSVTAPINVTLGTTPTYGEDTAIDNAYQVASGGTFDAKATIDMSNVKTQWDNYIARGIEILGAGATADEVISAVTLSGEFTVTITVDPAQITNSDPAHRWNENVTNLFTEASHSYSGGVYTVNMEFNDANKAALKTYFEDMTPLEMYIDGSTFTGTTQAHIASSFEGTVTLSISGIGSYTSETITITPSTDNDYVEPSTPTPTPTPTRRPSSGGFSRPTPTPTATATPTPTTTPTPDELATTVEPQLQGTASGAKLNYVDHYAYIIGYDNEDGTEVVRPENPITRAEVATIFYRLLTEESREQFRTQENDFSDVNEGDWFNNNVSTVAAAGIVNGYEDGTFKPNNYITRAEFAAIAARFTSLLHEGESLFNDTTGHWAEEAINNAAITGWISGYDDGSFEPDANITRAEAITLINRVLYRYVREDNLHTDMNKWADNTEDKWYYEAVQEATNSHDYDRKDIGYYETHTAISDPYDWESHEK